MGLLLVGCSVATETHSFVKALCELGVVVILKCSRRHMSFVSFKTNLVYIMSYRPAKAA